MRLVDDCYNIASPSLVPSEDSGPEGERRSEWVAIYIANQLHLTLSLVEGCLLGGGLALLWPHTSSPTLRRGSCCDGISTAEIVHMVGVG
jgi:hypothetical protein